MITLAAHVCRADHIGAGEFALQVEVPLLDGGAGAKFGFHCATIDGSTNFAFLSCSGVLGGV